MDVNSGMHSPHHAVRSGTAPVLAALTLSVLFSLTACSSGSPHTAGPTARWASPSPTKPRVVSSPRTPPSRPNANFAAAKDGVTVKKPVLKSTGDAFWVAVDVTNTGAGPAKYLTYIRLTGPLGYNALLRVQTDTLQPGAVRSAVYTARDESAGAIIPKHPTVVVVEVFRTVA